MVKGLDCTEGELKSIVTRLLKSTAENVYEKGIEKLVSQYDKYLNSYGNDVEVADKLYFLWKLIIFNSL